MLTGDLGWLWLGLGALAVVAFVATGIVIRRSRHSRGSKLDAAFNRARASRQVSSGYKPSKK